MTSTPPKTLLAAWYLLATPVFAILDFAFDLSWRVAGLAPTGGRIAYYAALMILGLAIRRFPPAAGLAAVIESSVAIALVLITAWTDILGLAVTPPDATVPDLGWLMNLLLCGSVGIYAFNRALQQLREP